MIPLKDNVPGSGVPAVTIALIGLCLLVFCWQLTLSGKQGSAGDRNGEIVVGDFSERDEFAAKYGTSPARIAGHPDEVEFRHRPPTWMSPATAFPVAADLLHLAINLLFLLIFGRTLEARLGRIRFGALLVLAVAAGAGAQALADPDSTGLVVGASTGLAGLLGAYAVLYPRAAIVSVSLIPGFGTVLEVPALLMIAAWLGIGLIPAVGPMVDVDLVAGLGVEFVGYAGAIAIGAAAAGLLGRGRPAATLAAV